MFVIKDGDNNTQTVILSIVAGVAAAILIFFLLKLTIEELLLPGDKVRKVSPADEAIKRVKAGHIAFISLVSYLALKLCGKR